MSLKTVKEIIPGASPDIGAVADTAITDPTAAASVIAALKGLLKQLQGDGSGAVPTTMATSLDGILDSISQKRIWEDSVSLAATDAYGGAVADLAADGAYDYTGVINLKTGGYRGARITIFWTPQNATDNLLLQFLGSEDGTTFAAIPDYSIEVDNAGVSIAIKIEDVPYLKIGLADSGTSTTFDYEVTYSLYR